MVIAIISCIAYTFNAGSHELINADAEVVGVDVSALCTGDQVERALVRVGD